LKSLLKNLFHDRLKGEEREKPGFKNNQKSWEIEAGARTGGKEKGRKKMKASIPVKLNSEKK